MWSVEPEAELLRLGASMSERVLLVVDSPATSIDFPMPTRLSGVFCLTSLVQL